jgi:soluble lytic murein transglycosylase
MRLGPALIGALLLARLAAAPAPAAAQPADPGLARYRDGHFALAAGDYDAARALFESVPAASLLGDYGAFFAAEALLRAGDAAVALERFRAFIDRFGDSTLVPIAQLAVADTTFRLGRWAEAERDARRFLTRTPNHPEASRILVRLAEARAAQGQVTEAMADLRRRWVEAPASPWGEAAREVLEDLAAAQGLPVAPLTPDERMLQAERYVGASDFAAAARVLEPLVSEPLEPSVRHRMLTQLAPALGRIQRGADAIALLQGALAEPPTPWRAQLLYELARQARRIGDPAGATGALERLVAEHPDATVIPEAWLALGRARLDLGQGEPARDAFQTLVRAHPDTTAAASAQWELGWSLYRAHRYRDAALAFRQLSARGPGFRLAGLYWAARALDAVPEKTAAAALYRELASRAPHTYYGVLALRRLKGPAPAPVAAPIRLPADPIALLEPDRHFQKSRALWRLGFEGHALLELETLGRDAVVESERAYGLGVAFAQIGEAGRSLRYLRRAFGGAAEAGTPGLTEQFWKLFYPFGYADVVRDAARRTGLDPFFVAAVIREESSYDARARSWVGAIGLMQLMPDTARVVAGTTGVRLAEPAGLWEPPVNILLGTHYLAQLRQKFQEPLLAVASYNAGPHRVQRWREQYRTPDLEEFVDQIPFDETRAFVKRVYASWHHYRRLYGTAERPPRRGEAEATPRTGR